MKKEHYFTPANRYQKALDMRRDLETRRRDHPIRFAPRRSALLVLDMQAFFLSQASHAWIPSGEAIIPGVQALVQEYAARGLPIVFTRHLNSRQDAGLMATWWRDLIATDDPLSAIVPDLDTSTGEVIQKSQYDAFYRTALEARLRGRGVTQVVISGVMTHLCCDTTARSAFMRGFEVFFLIDGTATYHEQFHRAALLNLSHGFAVPLPVADVLAALEAGAC